ncbi:MAG: NapC/NirT family cytochrome c [Rubrobacteridae bacterium]|nr:NapC/NirT family cytochrome c [Rubrobacteridae bacterium]
MKTKNITLGPILIVAFVVIMGVAFWGTSQSGFCANCHEIKPSETTWKMSSHSKVDCVACHIEPGPVNTVVKKVSAIQEVAVHFTSSFTTPLNKDSALSKTMPSEQCTVCHNAPISPKFGLLAFPHDKHSKTNCAYCHNRVAHEGYTTYVNRVEMESCIKCHEGKKVSVACTTCHPDGVAQKPSNHLTGDWISSHKPMASSKCYSGCHSQTFCNNCHSGSKTLPASHKAANWSKSHKTSVNASCAESCHTQTFCNKCHKNSTARPASHTTGNWVGTHKNSANLSCTNGCHVKSYCNNCHQGQGTGSLPASHKAANWSSSHRKVANSSCTSGCHSKSFCDNCHRSSNARPASHNTSSWSRNHEGSVNAGCTTGCHNQPVGQTVIKALLMQPAPPIATTKRTATSATAVKEPGPHHTM